MCILWLRSAKIAVTSVEVSNPTKKIYTLYGLHFNIFKLALMMTTAVGAVDGFF